MGSPPGSSEIIIPRPRLRARELDSIDPGFRFDLAANSLESETHFAYVNERSLTESEDSTLRLIPVGPSPGMGRFLFSGPTSSRYHSRLITIGFLAPIELDGNSPCEMVGRLLKSSPFLGFCEPVFHFFLGDSGPFTTHNFRRRKMSPRLHHAAPKKLLKKIMLCTC